MLKHSTRRFEKHGAAQVPKRNTASFSNRDLDPQTAFSGRGRQTEDDYLSGLGLTSNQECKGHGESLLELEKLTKDSYQGSTSPIRKPTGSLAENS